MSSNNGIIDTFSLGAASTNTSSRSTSTVRPRTRRLISVDDVTDEDYGRPMQSTGLSTTTLSGESSAIRSRGATPSPHTSRGASPLPMRHPSRATESFNRDNLNGFGVPLGGLGQTGKAQTKFSDSSRAAVDFLDVSWTSLQSLASSFLGSDIARSESNGTARTHSRKPSRPDPCMRATPKIPSAWGPSAPSTSEIGAGTKEERQAMLQAKKREALLLADTGLVSNRDTRHKRRDSCDQTGHSAIDPKQDEDALAYIHHVQPNDSITGVAIKYGCQPAIFRKANGFWPSDSIQSRKTVLLPVASCSVKGRPVRAQPEVDLLSGSVSNRDSLEDLSGSSIAPAPSSGTRASSAEGEASTELPLEGEADRIWKHQSWVQIDGFPAPVEIGRVPRRALGFFPRTRRKSLSYTDSEPRSSISGRERTATLSSTLSSPTESPSSQAFTAQNRSTTDPSRSRTMSNAKPRPHHQRQRSNIQLVGTGVGTLDRSAMAPGPALDGLSKFVAQHLPNLAPAPAPPSLGRTPSEYASATASTASTSLDNIGGAVEGWVRKMTTRAKAGLSDLQQGAQSYQGNSRAGTRRGMGDLIELNDGLESRNSSGLLAGSLRKPDLSRSGSNLHDASSLRGRFSSPSSSGTSRTRTGGSNLGYGDRVKDD
ncbi:putative LysM domain protein [Aspergillus thermomutatus]|uniref:LysM domain-containing protein n=1 Tax=Aspergillus thermomutatus TaxID=41047 RepID=A0A397HHX9_ASPTH|nr:uncharacterized protein CDV56_101763 [Aspergillus thermomutatus]RHZ60090.1 hypothetical protein CDV56_101763 [Aspergillus thermomutatus]